MAAYSIYPLLHAVGVSVESYIHARSTCQVVSTRNNVSNGQPNHTNTNNPINLMQLIATQNNLMQAVLQTLNHMQPNQQPHQQQAPPPPPPHQSRLAEFLQTHPTTFSQAQDPMEAGDWVKGIEKKVMITQCMDHMKVLFAAHHLFGMEANWWETYCNTHVDINLITWNEFQTRFHTHYVPRSTMELKKEFAPDAINTDEKKHDMFLNGLNDDVQFQLLNMDYADFQHMVNKAIVVENKIKEMENGGKRKPPFLRQSSGSNVRPRLSQPS
jgi:hypothetical protein